MFPFFIRLLVLGAACVAASTNLQQLKTTDLPPIGPFPNGYAWGCLPGNVSASLPFCDPSLSVKHRVADLIARLSLEEKMMFLGGSNETGVDTCNCMDNGNSRLGLSPYMNLVETNTAVNSHCVTTDVCATEFPGPTNLAASFNRTLWRAKGKIISTEMRALNNINWWRGMEQPFTKIGLSGFGPNINIVRDPRFGRNSELPSEDPFLSGSYAIEYVNGCQHGDDEDPRFLKMLSGLKHYDAYSVEDNRAGRMFNISTYDLFDTYLSQYRMAFHPDMGDARAVMCSYAGVNGVPSCANDFLLNQVVRGLWGRSDVVVVTDCGAIGNMVGSNMYAANNSDAAAKALNGGSDIDFGDNFFPPESVGGNGGLAQALQEGLTDEFRIDEALTRILTNRFLVGLFDPLDDQVYTKIGAESINSTAAQQLLLEGALQGMVLLKNEDNTLPFQASGKTIAVIGPHIYSQRDLFEDYKGDESCFGGGYDCIPTIASTFTQMAEARGGNVILAQGVNLDDDNTTGIPAAIDAVTQSDYVVLCIGIGNEQEHEGIDRTEISLPGEQEPFALKVLQTAANLKIPVVIVLINGGIVTIDNVEPFAPAIIESFYPAKRGPEALFLHIFGEANAWGKLPVTYYNGNFTSQISMYDFNMTAFPGRTYRYYTQKPLWPFGYGLSYTTFSVSCSQDTEISISCQATNTGSRDGDAVFMLFHQFTPSQPVHHPVPFSSLRNFVRLSIPSGLSASFEFQITSDDFVSTNSDGDRVVYPGAHTLFVTDGIAADPANSFSYNLATYSVLERMPRRR